MTDEVRPAEELAVFPEQLLFGIREGVSSDGTDTRAFATLVFEFGDDYPPTPTISFTVESLDQLIGGLVGLRNKLAIGGRTREGEPSDD